MDTCARTLIAVEKMINDGSYDDFLQKRYQRWDNKKELMSSDSLENIYQRVKSENINPKPQSGRQEYLENLINSYIE